MQAWRRASVVIDMRLVKARNQEWFQGQWAEKDERKGGRDGRETFDIFKSVLEYWLEVL